MKQQKAWEPQKPAYRFNSDSINVLLRDVQSRWFKRPTTLP
jgi:hypothetical protein